jgi:phosphoribosyl 1,2-cyclic phosphodiesterase
MGKGYKDMQMCSIASGSSGNCIYIGSEDTHLLIDAGISKKRVEKGLESISLKGEDIAGILVTHEHSDHIQGLGVFSRKYNVPIYATAGTIKGIERSSSLGKMPEGLITSICADEAFTIGTIKIDPFTIPHDANEPVGYRLESDGKAVAVATDLGVYDDYIISKLQNLDALLIEANHDTHMLEVGAYPYQLKRRILSEKGHLSNETSGRLLCSIIHKGLKNIILGHLSKDNNYAMLAYETVKLELQLGLGSGYEGQINLQVANRDTVSKSITI